MKSVALVCLYLHFALNWFCVIVLLQWVASYDGPCIFLAALHFVLLFTLHSFHSCRPIVVPWRLENKPSLSLPRPIRMTNTQWWRCSVEGLMPVSSLDQQPLKRMQCYRRHRLRETKWCWTWHIAATPTINQQHKTMWHRHNLVAHFLKWDTILTHLDYQKNYRKPITMLFVY